MKAFTLLLFVIAAIEGFLIWELWTHRTPCAAAAGTVPSAQPFAGGAGAGNGGGSGNGTPLPPSTPVPASATPATRAGAGGSPASGTASGDLNQVPDPNCVGRTTASLLNAGQSTTPPSCPPMSPSP